MRKSLLFVVVWMLVWFGMADPVQVSSASLILSLQTTSCNIYYNNDAQGNPQFLSCATKGRTSINWGVCFISCCGTSQSNTYSTISQSALDYCWQVAGTPPSEMNAMKISFIVLLSIFLVAFFISLYCCWRKMVERRMSNSRQVMQAKRLSEIVKDVEWPQEKEINFDKNSQLVWSTNANKDKILKVTDQPCTICLEEQTTTELFCGHQYHAHCIGSWLQKSTLCPCCRREDIRGAKVYCQSCRWRYFVCTRTLLTERGKQLPLICETCANSDPLVVQESSQYALHCFGSSNKLKEVEVIVKGKSEDD